MGRNSLAKSTLEGQYLSAAHKTAYYGKDHYKAKQAWAIYFQMKEKKSENAT